ncbi:MAG: peptidoglycan-binding protein [Myxococcota bacterium]|nr:peptidoglycan-binding protein [Myxococcota bacterium]
MGDRKDLDKDGDQDIRVKGRLDRRGKRTIKALEERCAAEPGFMDKLEKMCDQLGMEPEWVVNVMMMESNIDPAKKNPRSSASGLIQFMAKTARALGTTTAKLRSMSATKQLDYVEKYFRPFAGKLSSQAAVYAAVGAGQVGTSNSSVLFRRGSDGYNANKVWDVNKDGKVTQGEMGRVAGRFGAGEQFDIDEDSDEGSTTETSVEAGATGGVGGETATGDRERSNRIIGASVGARGQNLERDVEAVQTTLAAHGVSPGSIDRQIGANTIGAIRRFQRGFMRNPDGLVEPGQATEQHLMSANPPRAPSGAREGVGGGEVELDDDEDTERETDAPSRNASAQMARLESVADNVAGRRPGGMCYAAVKRHISNAGGYGNIRNIYTDRRFQPQGEARNFAEVVNRNPARFGLERLSISNPYDAPVGSIVVVAAGSPGTRHRTAGDIVVKGPGNAFYNDGAMGYRGRNAWPPQRGGVLGVYRPK